VYNRGFTTVVILDNRTTGMTGHQPHPSSGMTVRGDFTTPVDIEALCRAIGVKHVHTVNPNDIAATERIVKQETERPEPSVIITRSPCVLLPEMRKQKDKKLYVVIPGKCTGCKTCLRLGCPAIEWVALTPEEAKKLGYKEKQKGYARINAVLCDGCGQCAPLCKFKAIVTAGEDET
jgi:indolepyruvate ferredoxin oxidoreductase alpha subunit